MFAGAQFAPFSSLWKEIYFWCQKEIWIYCCSRRQAFTWFIDLRVWCKQSLDWGRRWTDMEKQKEKFFLSMSVGWLYHYLLSTTAGLPKNIARNEGTWRRIHGVLGRLNLSFPTATSRLFWGCRDSDSACSRSIDLKCKVPSIVIVRIDYNKKHC